MPSLCCLECGNESIRQTFFYNCTKLLLFFCAYCRLGRTKQQCGNGTIFIVTANIESWFHGDHQVSLCKRRQHVDRGWSRRRWWSVAMLSLLIRPTGLSGVAEMKKIEQRLPQRQIILRRCKQNRVLFVSGKFGLPISGHRSSAKKLVKYTHCSCEAE